MTLAELRKKIETKDANLAVIGMGYVGLPVACEFANVGFDVLGVELREERVAKINAGISPIEGKEPGLVELLQQSISSGRLRATTQYNELIDRDIVLIDVETPIDEYHKPRYEALRSAIRSLGPVLKDGALVIVESTVSPGTLRDLVVPLLEEESRKQLNQDFYAGNCPERVMPGRLLENLRSMSRVVGGMTPETTETMKLFYRNVVDGDLDVTDSLTAELVKTTENAYRDVQIAFANEVALICEAVGGDVWKVRELVNKVPARNMHLPGAGVGGHCITKDPWLLAVGAKDKEVPLRLIPAARVINDSMPMHVFDLLQDALEVAGREGDDARVLILGYAYLEDSDDTRNSPSQILELSLQATGAEVSIHDPYVLGYHGDLYQKARGCDAVIIMVRHQEYLSLNLALLKSSLRTPVLIDGRHVINSEQALEVGFLFRGIGQAMISSKTKIDKN